jgi:hypothetical protein
MPTTIYALHDPTTDALRYVGKSSRSLRTRLSRHMTLARKGESLYNWIRSLPAVPVMRTWSTVPDAHGARAEVATIALCRALGMGLVNGTDGGDGVTGLKHSPETRVLCRLAATGNKTWVGRKHSPEAKERMAAAKRGRKQSREAVEKRIAPLRGRKHSAEHRARIGLSMVGNQNGRGHR